MPAMSTQPDSPADTDAVDAVEAVRYLVEHDYRAYSDGQWVGPWRAGDVVQIDAGVAAWVNRDSPGTLVPVDSPTPQAPTDPATPSESSEPPADGTGDSGPSVVASEPDATTPSAGGSEPATQTPRKGGRGRTRT